MSNEREDYEHNPIDVSEFFEISEKPEESEETLPATTESAPPPSSGVHADTEIDYENARRTYYELVEKGQQALDNLLEIASSSEHPRAFEVSAQMIKTISDTNDRIVELQNQMRKISEMDARASDETDEKGNTVNNNAVFVGSMSDFQQFIKQMKKKGKEANENIEEQK